MSYYTYVLKSAIGGHIYIGSTANILVRLSNHNAGLSSSTVRYKPWRILFTEEYKTRAEAMKREKQLKTSRGRGYIRSIINR